MAQKGLCLLVGTMWMQRTPYRCLLEYHTVVSCWKHPIKELDRHSPGVCSRQLKTASDEAETSGMLQEEEQSHCPGSSPVQI